MFWWEIGLKHTPSQLRDIFCQYFLQQLWEITLLNTSRCPVLSSIFSNSNKLEVSQEGEGRENYCHSGEEKKKRLSQLGKPIWETAIILQNATKMGKINAYVDRNRPISKDRDKKICSLQLLQKQHTVEQKCQRIRAIKNRTKLLNLYSLLWSVNFQVEFQL